MYSLSAISTRSVHLPAVKSGMATGAPPKAIESSLKTDKVSLALVQQWLGHATIDTTIRFYGHLNIDNAIATGKTIEHSKWFDNVYNVIDDELRERASLVSCGLEDTED